MVQLNAEFEISQKAYELFDKGQLDDAINLTLSLENHASLYKNEYEHDLCLKYAAICLIDIGSAAQQKNMIERGTEYLRNFLEKHVTDNHEKVIVLYNIANGYSAIWTLDYWVELKKGVDSKALQLSRRFYRQAISLVEANYMRSDLACEIYTNYAIILNHTGRSVEALDAYDTALRINPDMGMALGNKGITLANFG